MRQPIFSWLSKVNKWVWRSDARQCPDRAYDASRTHNRGHAMCAYGIAGHRCMQRLCPRLQAVRK